MKLYLDDSELRLKNHGFGFTGATEPIERLDQLVEVSDENYTFELHEPYVVVRRKDGKEGNFEAYIANCAEEILGVRTLPEPSTDPAFYLIPQK